MRHDRGGGTRTTRSEAAARITFPNKSAPSRRRGPGDGLPTSEVPFGWDGLLLLKEVKELIRAAQCDEIRIAVLSPFKVLGVRIPHLIERTAKLSALVI